MTTMPKSRLDAIQLRPATLDDVGRISQLIHGLSGPFLLSSDGAGAEQFFASIDELGIKRYVCADNFTYLVAEHLGTLAGLVALRDNAHLFHLFVAQEFQGIGLARRLWEAVSRAAMAAGSSGKFTVNASLNATGVYRHFGFVETSDVVHAHGIAFQPMSRSSGLRAVVTPLQTSKDGYRGEI